MFTDIESLSKLDPYVVGDAEDTEIGDLPYTDSYCKEVSYDGKEYEVYAYIFKDVAAAQAYFKEATGMKTDWNRNYGMVDDLLYRSKTFFYQTCLYRVEGGSLRSTADFINWLNEDFPIHLISEDSTEQE